MERGAARRGRHRRAHGDDRAARAAGAAGPRIMMDPARYLAFYLAPVAPRAASDIPSTLPPLELRNFYLDEHEVETPPLSLPQLFSAGVECGHTEARAELKRR